MLGPGASLCSVSKNGYPHLATVLPVWDVSEWRAWPAHSPDWGNNLLSLTVPVWAKGFQKPRRKQSLFYLPIDTKGRTW